MPTKSAALLQVVAERAGLPPLSQLRHSDMACETLYAQKHSRLQVHPFCPGAAEIEARRRLHGVSPPIEAPMEFFTASPPMRAAARCSCCSPNWRDCCSFRPAPTVSRSGPSCAEEKTKLVWIQILPCRDSYERLGVERSSHFKNWAGPEGDCCPDVSDPTLGVFTKKLRKNAG